MDASAILKTFLEAPDFTHFKVSDGTELITEASASYLTQEKKLQIAKIVNTALNSCKDPLLLEGKSRVLEKLEEVYTYDPVAKLLESLPIPSEASLREILLGLASGDAACAEAVINNLDHLSSSLWVAIYSLQYPLLIDSESSLDVFSTIYFSLKDTKSYIELYTFLSKIFPEDPDNLYLILERCDPKQGVAFLKVLSSIPIEERAKFLDATKNLSASTLQTALDFPDPQLHVDILHIITHSQNALLRRLLCNALLKVPEKQRKACLQTLISLMADKRKASSLWNILILFQCNHLSLEEKKQTCQFMDSLSSEEAIPNLVPFIAKGHHLTEDLTKAFFLLDPITRNIVLQNLNCIADPVHLLPLLQELQSLDPGTPLAYKEKFILQTFLSQWQELPEFEYAAILLRKRLSKFPPGPNDPHFRFLSAIISLPVGERIPTLKLCANYLVTEPHFHPAILQLRHLIPEDNRDPIFSIALQLCDRTQEDSCSAIILGIGFLDPLTPEEIKLFESIPTDIRHLFICHSFLVPKSQLLEAIDIFNQNPYDFSKKLNNLIMGPNRKAYFDHFTHLLESPNIKLVAQVSEALLENLINTNLLSIDDELAQFIIHKYILSHPTLQTAQNPYFVYHRILDARQKSFPVTVPFQGDVRLNLSRLEDIVDEMLKARPKPSYAELAALCGGKLVTPDSIREMFSTFADLKEMPKDLIAKQLRESLHLQLTSLKALEDNLCEDPTSLSWQRYDKEDKIAPVSVIQFNLYIHYLRTSPHLSDGECGDHFFSEREVALLRFSDSFHKCPTGRAEQLAVLYNLLPSEAKQWAETKKEFPLSYVYDKYQSFLLNFLNNDPSFLKELLGTTASVHDSNFIKNLIARRLGLEWDPLFDPHTHSIPMVLIDKKTEDILQLALNHLSLPHLIATIKAQIISDLQGSIDPKRDEETPQQYAQRTKKGAELGVHLNALFGDQETNYPGYYQALNLDEVTKELVSDLGVEELLIATGILARKKEGETDSISLISRGL